MQFNESVRIIINNDRVIIGNICNGHWIKISKECYNVLKYLFINNITEDGFHDLFEDNTDIKYFLNLIEKFKQMHMLRTEKTEHEETEFEVTIAITNNCNMSCRHCCVNSGSNTNDPTKEQLLDIMNKVISFSPKTIILTGGEPMIRSDFSSIVKHLRGNFDKELALMTNGTMINEENVRIITENFDSISISIDGYDKQSCLLIRNADIFEKVIHAVRLLQSNGLNNISLTMTVTKFNCGNINDFEKLNETLGTKAIIRNYAPIGRGKENAHFFLDDEFEKKITKRNYSEHMIHRDLYNASFATNIYLNVCKACKNKFYIGSDTYIYPCGALSLVEFRLHKIDEVDNLSFYFKKEVYKESKGYTSYEAILADHISPCKDCNVRFFCSACPLYIYLYKKIGIFDNYCKIKKVSEQEIIWGRSRSNNEIVTGEYMDNNSM